MGSLVLLVFPFLRIQPANYQLFDVYAEVYLRWFGTAFNFIFNSHIFTTL